MPKGRSSGQGVKLFLIREYLYSHTNEDHFVNAKIISNHLATYGIKAEVKTIYNDIFILQQFGVPVEYNPRHHGYHITKPLFEPHELRLIVDSIQSSKFITASSARKMSDKIKSLADIYTKSTLNREAFVQERIHSENESVVKGSDKLHQAIADNRKISFKYFHFTPDSSKSKAYSKDGRPYIVSPFALLWEGGNYYLYAYVSEESLFKTFRVDRMERITILSSQPREGNDLYSAANVTKRKAKVFGMFHGKEYDIHLRFTNRFAGVIIDEFGKGVMLIPKDKDHFEVTVRVEISPPFHSHNLSSKNLPKNLVRKVRVKSSAKKKKQREKIPSASAFWCG